MPNTITKQSDKPNVNTARQVEKNIMKTAVQAEKSLFQLPKIGDVVEGVVIDKEGGVLYIDLGHIGIGVIFGVEYLKAQDEIKKLKKQDKVIAKIIEVENEDGYRELSMKEAKEEKNWKVMEEAQKSQNSLEVEITDANKGGLMARIGDLEGFLPVSQLAPANYSLI